MHKKLDYNLNKIRKVANKIIASRQNNLSHKNNNKLKILIFTNTRII